MGEGVRCVLHTKLILCIKGPTYKTACDAEVHLKKLNIYLHVK